MASPDLFSRFLIATVLAMKHPLPIRLSHWINVQLLLMMIWSGILIYWANPQYGEIPASAISILRINNRLAEGMGWHFLLMWPLAFNGLVYMIYSLYSGHWKKLLPDKTSVRLLFPFILADLHLTRKTVSYVGDYNPAQRFAYTCALFLIFISLFSGIAIYKPVQLGWPVSLLGGYENARLVHFISMVGITLFILIHVVQVIRAGWRNFFSMIAGD
jgi:thiosulfate reductase cytochrome b subunit